MTGKKQNLASILANDRLLSFAEAASGFGVWHADPSTGHTVFSDKALEILGAAEAEQPLSALAALCEPKDRKPLAAALAALCDRGAALDIEVSLSANDAQPVRLLGQAERDEAGAIIRLSGLVLPENELAGARASYARAQQMLTSLLNSISQGIAIYDAELRLEHWNAGFIHLHSLEAGQVRRGMHMSELTRIFAERGDYGSRDVDLIVAERMARVPHGSELREHRYERSLYDGSIVEVHGSPLPNGGLVTTYSDKTEHIEAIADAQRRATHDPLTGLPNRAKFGENLEQAIGHRQRNGSQLALLLLDLDHFKDINDTLGHPAGDELLIQAGERLLACARKTDTVARLGGDEFAVIGTNILEEDGHQRLAQRIHEAFSRPFIVGDVPILSGTSIGIAMFPPRGSITAEEFISNADMALYDAKASGRNNYRVFDGKMKEVVKERRALETDLRQALDEHAFTLYFQPQIDLARNRVIGAEALIRWTHPVRGMVPPSVFIPLVERVRLIDPLTNFVVNKACDHLVQFKEQGLGDLTVAVNASSLSLRSRTLLEMIRGALDRTGTLPNRLELEIVEGELINSAKGSTVLREVTDLGIRLALDSFGSGYSSLSRLRELPLTKLKVDRSFLGDATTDAMSAAMMESIIEMGVRLDLDVVCEGVETEDQLALLRDIGCPSGQGYLLGKPMSAAEFIELAKRLKSQDRQVCGEGQGCGDGPNRKSAA